MQLWKKTETMLRHKGERTEMSAETMRSRTDETFTEIMLREKALKNLR